MTHFQPFVILTTMLLSSLGELPKVVPVVRNAYEENVTALSAFGTIHFHATDGELGRASSVEEIRKLLKSDWERRSTSRGTVHFRRPEPPIREPVPARGLGRTASEALGFQREFADRGSPTAVGWRDHAHGRCRRGPQG